jgi:hypothetical protein
MQKLSEAAFEIRGLKGGFTRSLSQTSIFWMIVPMYTSALVMTAAGAAGPKQADGNPPRKSRSQMGKLCRHIITEAKAACCSSLWLRAGDSYHPREQP